MEDLNSAIAKIANYLKMPIQGVFFVAFDRPEDLSFIIRETSGCKKIHLSQYCHGDSTPDMDKFWQDIIHCQENMLILGLGEYVALIGDTHYLDRLWSMNSNSRKIILPVWNGYEAIRKYQEQSAYRPFAENVLFMPQGRNYWKFKKFLLPNQVECVDFKALLEKLENGCDREITVATRVNLKKEWGSEIASSYQLYCEQNPGTRVAESLFSEEQWQQIVSGADKATFFGALNLLALKENGTDNSYLAIVLDKTDSHAVFKKNFIELFLEMNPAEANFGTIAADRRKLLTNMDGGDMEAFLLQLQRYSGPDKLSWLSDTTIQEKFEIIKAIRNNRPENLESVYKDLALYMEKYVFPGEDIPGLHATLGQYFNEYKSAKLGNTIPENFLEKVIENSLAKSFLTLETRWSILEKLDDGKTMLFWVDALGCEFLAFIKALADENGLVMDVRTARAELPSITSMNNGFFANWTGPKEPKIEELDNIKHGKSVLLPASELKDFPLHLALELDAVRKVVLHIARLLSAGDISRVVLTSDHGATRLAVISGDEAVWEMPEPGRHSGRCCKETEAGSYKPACAVKDNQWYALADYSRFKGGHASSVEVHGGATLEEVVVPVITFALCKALPVIIQKQPFEIRLKPRDKSITIGIHSNMPLTQPEVHFANAIYPMRGGDEKLDYFADIPVSATGQTNEARVYDAGTRLEPPLRFTVIKGMKSKSLDDF